MKRVTFILLTLLLVLAACKDNSINEESLHSGEIAVSKGLFSVSLAVPITFYTGLFADQTDDLLEDIEEGLKENGAEDIKFLEDHVSYKMSKKDYKAYLEEEKESLDKLIEEGLDDDLLMDYEVNKDYTEMTLYVDQDAYLPIEEELNDYIEFVFGISIGSYQMMTGIPLDDIGTTFHLLDHETDEEITTFETKMD